MNFIDLELERLKEDFKTALSKCCSEPDYFFRQSPMIFFHWMNLIIDALDDKNSGDEQAKNKPHEEDHAEEVIKYDRTDVLLLAALIESSSRGDYGDDKTDENPQDTFDLKGQPRVGLEESRSIYDRLFATFGEHDDLVKEAALIGISWALAKTSNDYLLKTAITFAVSRKIGRLEGKLISPPEVRKACIDNDGDDAGLLSSLASIMGKHRAQALHADTYRLREEIVDHWKDNIDPALSAPKAANILIKHFPISHAKAAEYVRTAKKKHSP